MNDLTSAARALQSLSDANITIVLGEVHGDRLLVAVDRGFDLDAFRAIEDLEVGVRVAVVSPEAPEILREHADVCVESPAEFLELLRLL